MIKRVAELIETLGLLPHPEGGWYKETYRSEEKIQNKSRNLCTAIYFLITHENISKFHQIKSDELWFFHEGSGLTVHVLDEPNTYVQLQLGLDAAKGQSPQALVEKGKIFGSTVDQADGYALVSCVVAPGFDFEDFTLFEETELINKFPAYTEIISRLT